MKGTTKQIVAIAVALVALWWLWPESQPAPDERLVEHMDATCEIAKNNAKTPRRGVRELFAYLGDHSPTMMQQFGQLLVVIERIDDDAEHDARARQAARRLHEAARRCEHHWERFFVAVERDPEARARFERGAERLSRTIEILVGGQSGALPDWAIRAASL